MLTTNQWVEQNAFVSGAGNLRLRSWPDQIERNGHGSPPFEHFLKEAVYTTGALALYGSHKLATSLMQSNTASIMNICLFV